MTGLRKTVKERYLELAERAEAEGDTKKAASLRKAAGYCKW